MSISNELRPKTAIAGRFLGDLQLRGLAPHTQAKYMRAVRLLSYHFTKSPATITEEELREYFLYVINVKHWSHSSIRNSLCGIRFFFEHTLHKRFPVLEFIRPCKDTNLPNILSRDEVHQLLGSVRGPNYRVCLQLIYACGLRLIEAVTLQVPDIDRSRNMLHIRHGKGGKDRYVPLPERMLEILGDYWKSHSNPTLLFPTSQQAGTTLTGATQGMSSQSVANAFRVAVRASGINKHATVHTLRHSYATHLLEARVDLRHIQEYLGHASPRSTAIYTHLTEPSIHETLLVINRLMEGL